MEWRDLNKASLDTLTEFIHLFIILSGKFLCSGQNSEDPPSLLLHFSLVSFTCLVSFNTFFPLFLLLHSKLHFLHLFFLSTSLLCFTFFSLLISTQFSVKSQNFVQICTYQPLYCMSFLLNYMTLPLIFCNFTSPSFGERKFEQIWLLV